MYNFALIISLVHMSTRCVNHGALNVWRGQTVKVCICVESCEVLEEGLEVLVGVFNVLQVSNIVTICTHHMCKQNVVIQILLSVRIVSEGQLQSLSSISLLPFKAKLSICHIWVHKTLQKAIHM